ncbi:MAG: hypothetical protein IPJ79_14310 [Bacteroidetes bacterium]|nr:hypothetical protein [Bacteroidota bacterium]
MLLLTVKPFVILLLIPFLVAYYVCTEMQSARWILMRWGVVVFFFWMLAVVAGNVSKDYSIPYRLYSQQQSSLKFAVFRGDKSYHKPPLLPLAGQALLKEALRQLIMLLYYLYLILLILMKKKRQPLRIFF